MNKNELMSTATRALGKFGLKLKKHSPEILIVSGVVGVVTASVMACKATLKATEVIDETKENMDKIHEAAALNSAAYTVEDIKKDTVIVYTQAAVKLIKLYAPAVILGVASISSIFASNNIMRKRNVALAAAYATVDKGFKEYRNRVVERFGDEMDKELRYNLKAKEVELTTVDENGEVKTETKVIQVADMSMPSDYARFFDEYCAGWSKNPEHNLVFVRQQQNWANEKLQRQGYLFLNDVYDSLGIPKTSAGQQVGWIYDEKNPVGDNFVDFGIYDVTRPNVRDFVNGHERSVLLDFNVDGDILYMF